MKTRSLYFTCQNIKSMLTWSWIALIVLSQGNNLAGAKDMTGCLIGRLYMWHPLQSPAALEPWQRKQAHVCSCDLGSHFHPCLRHWDWRTFIHPSSLSVSWRSHVGGTLSSGWIGEPPCSRRLSTAVLVVQNISKNRSLSSCTLCWYYIYNVLPRCVMILVSVFLWSRVKSSRLTTFNADKLSPKGNAILCCVLLSALSCRNAANASSSACKFSLSSFMFLTRSCNICNYFWTVGLQIW